MVVLSTQDNVGVAVSDIEPGAAGRSATGPGPLARERIPLGHKIALVAIEAGAKIVRLGVPIGIATRAIAPGALVHVHNVRSQYLDNVEDHYE